jgi:ubiquinone/menaquinone biosynthesis C-methylase UbiE
LQASAGPELPRKPFLGGAGPFRQWLFAWAFSRCTRRFEAYMAPYKSRLFRGLSGVVLEIGPGSGPNLAYLDRASVRWIGVEPNRFMHSYLAKTARDLGFDVDLRHGSAEQLPAPDSSVDAVIATLVLCSVTDQARVLGEISRVLKPGGKFLFVEHVAARPGTRLRRIQEWITPIWRRFTSGCHPACETARAIENAGFRDIQIESFDAPLPIVKPHIMGVAVKA